MDPVQADNLLPRPVDTAVIGGVLLVTMRKEFDSSNFHQDWAQSVQLMHPGPFSRVVFDLSQCGMLSSTFFAGLIQLRLHYHLTGVVPMVLSKPDPRMLRNIKALRLDSMFEIIPR